MNQIAARGRPFYERFGWAYDLLVADSVEPWVDAVCTALGSLEIIAPAEILDAGCGTGRHAEELTARGHSVTLVDASEALLAQARRRVPTAAAVRTDLRKLDLHASFDAIACRGVLNDLIDDEDRDAVLGAFARHLRSSGVLVLDVRELSGTAQRYGTGHQAEKVIDTARGPLTYRPWCRSMARSFASMSDTNFIATQATLWPSTSSSCGRGPRLSYEIG